MNQGRIWCVVQPTIGLPLFLGAVALTSLAVHASVLNNTTWIKDYWSGSSKAKTAMLGTTSKVAVAKTDTAFDVRVANTSGADGAVTLTITPKTISTASAPTEKLAMNTVTSR